MPPSSRDSFLWWMSPRSGRVDLLVHLSSCSGGRMEGGIRGRWTAIISMWSGGSGMSRLT